jgi:hypothetical protein
MAVNESHGLAHEAGQRGYAAMSYDVAVDHGTLQRWSADETGTGYVVGITGTIDARWILAFEETRRRSASFIRFHFSPDQRLISFACRPNDDIAEIFSVLQILEAMIELINRRADEIQ